MQLVGGMMALSSLAGAPQQVQTAVTQLSPEQQEYFNRPNQNWDWGRMQLDAANSGMSLGQYMAQNWPTISSGAYVVKSERKDEESPPGKARGGALSSVAYLARGAGTGRSDEIDARLSDGEYVMDAETVALIGDGSTKAGAAKLDSMRQELRKHKGRALARGKFSPNAKSPLAYLKGAA